MSIKLDVDTINCKILCKIYSDKNPKILNPDISKDMILINNSYMYKYSNYTENIIVNSVFNKEWRNFINNEEQNICKNTVCKYPKEYFKRFIYFLNDYWCVISNNPDDNNFEFRNFIFIPTKSLNFNLLSAIMNIDNNTQWYESKYELVNAYACFISGLHLINNGYTPNNISIQFNNINNQHIGSLHGHFIFKKKNI